LALFLARLQFSGISIMQLFLVFYHVSYWYSTFLIAIVLVLSLVLFYLYTDTLRPLIAVVPLFIFFLSWRNLPSYATAFIPLLIAVYYFEKDDGIKDILHNKKLILYSLIILIAVCIVFLLYAHGTYLKSGNFQVTRVRALAGTNETGSYVFTGLSVNVSSKISKEDNLSFYVVSRNLNNIGLYGNETALPGYGYHDYLLNFSVASPNNGTKFYIFTMSNNYTSSTGINTKH